MNDKIITSYKSLMHESETDEIVINKSRFIGYAAHAMNEEDAKCFIDKVRELHPEASCICHAYICGMSQNVQKFHDGHEPVGGMPILEVMKMKGLTATVCAVVRYFGGTKLGVGGLARAFSGAAAKAVDLAVPCEYVYSEKYTLEYDYTYQGKLEYMLDNSHFEKGETQYAEKIKIELIIRLGEIEELNARVAAITSGNHTITFAGNFYKNWDN